MPSFPHPCGTLQDLALLPKEETIANQGDVAWQPHVMQPWQVCKQPALIQGSARDRERCLGLGRSTWLRAWPEPLTPGLRMTPGPGSEAGETASSPGRGFVPCLVWWPREGRGSWLVPGRGIPSCVGPGHGELQPGAPACPGGVWSSQGQGCCNAPGCAGPRLPVLCMCFQTPVITESIFGHAWRCPDRSKALLAPASSTEGPGIHLSCNTRYLSREAPWIPASPCRR